VPLTTPLSQPVGTVAGTSTVVRWYKGKEKALISQG